MYHALRGFTTLEGRGRKALMPVHSARGKVLDFGVVVRLKLCKMVLQESMREPSNETLLRSEGIGKENLREVPPVCKSGVDTWSWCWFVQRVLILGVGVGPWRCCVFLGLVTVLSAVEIQSACVGKGAVMSRARPRMGTRRGGIQGRALPQDDYYSPSSSLEVTSRPQRLQGSIEEERGQHGSSPNSEEGQRELPMLRYRLPCPQVNSTLVVSIAVEPGATQNVEVKPLPEGQRSSRENSPIACLPIGSGKGWTNYGSHPGPSWMAPGHDRVLDLERPAINREPEAGPSTHADFAGPSRPAREGSPDAVIQLSDSEDVLRFGCQIAEAPQTTEED